MKTYNEDNVEESTSEEPAYNIGQKVVWLFGIKYHPGKICVVTRIYQSDGVRWYLELDGHGSSYPGRVKTYKPPKED